MAIAPPSPKKLGNAPPRKASQGHIRLVAEGHAFGSCLNFDPPAITGHNKIGIGIGGGIFTVIKIKQWRAVDNSSLHGSHR